MQPDTQQIKERSVACIKRAFEPCRYHGHSISDPGTTYRTRDDIKAMRTARDPIEHVKILLQEHNFATAQELKAIEKEVRTRSALACIHIDLLP